LRGAQRDGAMRRALSPSSIALGAQRSTALRRDGSCSRGARPLPSSSPAVTHGFERASGALLLTPTATGWAAGAVRCQPP
jgi:hypothetical protein